MNFEQLLLSKKISANHLCKISGVPRTTILDMIRGRSDIKKASGITLYKMAKALNVSIESLIELDTASVIDTKTGKPTDKSYFECSLDINLANILRNLKNDIYTNNELKQSFWKDRLLEEITSLRRNGSIGSDSFEYFYEKYLGGES